MYASGCRELQRELTVAEGIEILDPAAFLALLVFAAISGRGLQNATWGS